MQPLSTIQVIELQIKILENIAFTALNILVGDFQSRMWWNISIVINACTHVDLWYGTCMILVSTTSFFYKGE